MNVLKGNTLDNSYTSQGLSICPFMFTRIGLSGSCSYDAFQVISNGLDGFPPLPE